MLFPNWEEKRRDGGKGQDILSRKEEMLRELKSEQVLFRDRGRRKARVGVWGKSGYYDEVAMREKTMEKGDIPVFPGF